MNINEVQKLVASFSPKSTAREEGTGIAVEIPSSLRAEIIPILTDKFNTKVEMQKDKKRGGETFTCFILREKSTKMNVNHVGWLYAKLKSLGILVDFNNTIGMVEATIKKDDKVKYQQARAAFARYTRDTGRNWSVRPVVVDGELCDKFVLERKGSSDIVIVVEFKELNKKAIALIMNNLPVGVAVVTQGNKVIITVAETMFDRYLPRLVEILKPFEDDIMRRYYRKYGGLF